MPPTTSSTATPSAKLAPAGRRRQRQRRHRRRRLRHLHTNFGHTNPASGSLAGNAPQPSTFLLMLFAATAGSFRSARRTAISLGHIAKNVGGSPPEGHTSVARDFNPWKDFYQAAYFTCLPKYPLHGLCNRFAPLACYHAIHRRKRPAERGTTASIWLTENLRCLSSDSRLALNAIVTLDEREHDRNRRQATAI